MINTCLKIFVICFSTLSIALPFHGETIDIHNYAKQNGTDIDSITDWQPIIAQALQSHDSIFELYFPPGIYVIKNTILKQHGLKFSLKGNGATIKLDQPCLDSSRSIFIIKYCHIVSISNLTIDGCFSDSVENKSGNGFEIDKSDSVTVSNCIVRKVRGSGICGASSSHCIIENNSIEHCAQNGILFGYTNHKDAIGFSADNNIIRENRITKTYFQNGIFITSNFASQSSFDTLYGYIITRNRIDSAGDVGIESGLRVIGSLILRNTISNSRNISILVRDNRHCTVKKNYCIQTPNRGEMGNITIDSPLEPPNEIKDAHATVEENTVVGGKKAGIQVNGVNMVMVINNTIKDCQNHGISLSDVSFSGVFNNTITNQHFFGIALYGNLTRDDIERNIIAMSDSVNGRGFKVEKNSILLQCHIRKNIVRGFCLFGYQAFSDVSFIHSDFSDNHSPKNKGSEGFQ